MPPDRFEQFLRFCSNLSGPLFGQNCHFFTANGISDDAYIAYIANAVSDGTVADVTDAIFNNSATDVTDAISDDANVTDADGPAPTFHANGHYV
jgi:hypothetical protein